MQCNYNSYHLFLCNNTRVNGGSSEIMVNDIPFEKTEPSKCPFIGEETKTLRR